MRFSIRKGAKLFVLVTAISFLGFLYIANFDANSDQTPLKLSTKFQHGGVMVSNLTNFTKLYKRLERSIEADEQKPGDHSRAQKGVNVKDIFISIKSTAKNHRPRLKILLDTWIKNAKNQTYIFTDQDDYWLQGQMPANHVVNTQCPQDHYRKSLCCKMAVEFDTFIVLKKKWFCHVDDDTYVNIPRLVTMLAKYNYTEDWYLGKPSLKHPIEISDRQHPGQKHAFWFATGGAGFCISRALALKMVPHAGGGRIMRVGDLIRLPDDCTLGYIINSLLHKELTVIQEFHSHLEPLWRISPQNIKEQITLSYKLSDERPNVVKIPEYSNREDPTRFWAIHCYLNPMTKDCLTDR